MTATAVVEVEGHIIDSLILAKILDVIVDAGAAHRIVDMPVGKGRTVPMHRVRAGDLVVIGSDGVRVHPLEKPRGHSPFEFMISDVSSEKPKALLVAQVATRIRAAKERGGKLLAVCGPAVVHTGAAP